MCKDARHMLSDEVSDSVPSVANMTQLSNEQIMKHLRPSTHEPNESLLMHVHARKENCAPRNANSVAPIQRNAKCP